MHLFSEELLAAVLSARYWKENVCACIWQGGWVSEWMHHPLFVIFYLFIFLIMQLLGGSRAWQSLQNSRMRWSVFIWLNRSSENQSVVFIVKGRKAGVIDCRNPFKWKNTTMMEGKATHYCLHSMCLWQWWYSQRMSWSAGSAHCRVKRQWSNTGPEYRCSALCFSDTTLQRGQCCIMQHLLRYLPGGAIFLHPSLSFCFFLLLICVRIKTIIHINRGQRRKKNI